MNHQQARSLITETFTQTFDSNRFLTFTGNLLNNIDRSKAFTCNSQYVKDAFKPHIRRYERLATYTAPDERKIDIMVVHLTKKANLARTRTALRNFVADYLKQRDQKDAALVAFVSPTENAWRFSYVKMEYATVEKPSGDLGTEARLTPARRFSYIVGPGESCHTAQTRFLDLLQNTQTNPQLKDIEEAFSVEAVTKEFFTRYKELALEVKDELDKLAAADNAIDTEFAARKVNTIDFAKKLMGQIVFLYFLQKKGWLGVAKGEPWGTGPHNFLRKLSDGDYGQRGSIVVQTFQSATVLPTPGQSASPENCGADFPVCAPHAPIEHPSNFFNDTLEPLFYDTLATDRGHEAFCEQFNCRIPFLNGGLFEPLNNYNWRKTEILLPNRLFANTEPVEEGITGTGILDVFDRYNFTVNEAEPLEKEVAIDPEMLGKVFENLLEVKERKSKGSFYTPREIVHYMCQESLINYLDTTMNGSTDIPVCVSTAEIHKTSRNLPHWTSEGSVYWITFQLADSLPQEKLNAWRAERELWLNQHPQPWSDDDWKEYDESIGDRLQSWLDAGYGSCALMRPDVRQIVQDCLLRFDGERLRLYAAVIMPNHVHLLLEPLAGNELSEILKGIKGASARKANQILGNTGTAFWMDESYDHIVRSERQRQHFVQYITENPVKAKLPAGQFWLHQGSTGIPACTLAQGDTDIPVCIPAKTPTQVQETQTRMSVLPRPQTQTRMSVLPRPQSQTGMSVLRCDIEKFIHHGDRIADYDAVNANHGIEMPAAIKNNARLLDEKLAAITVCDPAVGSGAFLVGMMQEIVRARGTLTEYLKKHATNGEPSVTGSGRVPASEAGGTPAVQTRNAGILPASGQATVCSKLGSTQDESANERSAYHFKRHAIQSCLYGVDIDPGAVEIAKLRLWLSLVVDEEDVKQIKPLPNLDYKVVAGNSLLGVEKNIFNANLFEWLEELKPKYFDETNSDKKQEFRREIDQLIHQLTNGNETFDFEIYFSEVFRHEKKGFDVVIGNPPYGFRNVLDAKEKKYFRKERRIDFPSGDVAELFILFSQGKLTRPGGTLTFIIPKKSLYGQSWKNVRKLWGENSLGLLMDASQAFEKVLLEQVSFSIRKSPYNPQRRISVGRLNADKSSIEIFGTFDPREIFTNDLRNVQIYRGLYPKSLVAKIAQASVDEARNPISGSIGISNLTPHLTFEADGNYPCIKGIDIVRYGLKPAARYIPRQVAREYLDECPKVKLVSQEIVAHVQNPQPHIVITMFLDREKRLLNDTCVEIRLADARLEPNFVMAYFHSTFANWYAYNFVYNRAIRTMHFIDFYIRQIALPKAVLEDPKKQKPIITLVDQIMAAKKHDPDADTSALEREIDQIVYQLYNLTPEDIAIVEGAG